jgi:hypothetical protein
MMGKKNIFKILLDKKQKVGMKAPSIFLAGVFLVLRKALPYHGCWGVQVFPVDLFSEVPQSK